MADTGRSGGRGDDVRCAQADRDRCADVLKAAWAEGRLTDEEYHGRLERALAARTYGDLAGLVHDLPVGPVPEAARERPVPMVRTPYGYAVAPPPPPRANGLAVTSMVVGIVTLAAMWPVTLVMMWDAAFNPFPIVGATVAIATGVAGLRQSRTLPYPDNGGSGMAVAGITLGWVQVALALLAEIARH